MSIVDPATPARLPLSAALPFWLSLILVPMTVAGAVLGSWWIALIPLWVWVLMPLLDGAMGLSGDDLSPDTPDGALHWYRVITLIWAPLQGAMILLCLAATFWLSPAEQIWLFVALGSVTGGIGITYAHELIHQTNRRERALGDFLLTSVLYGHFRSEHLLVHHIHVATPRDPVTARAGEGFWRFFPRVLTQQPVSSWAVETDRLRRRGRSIWSSGNPFWIYGLGALAWLALAWSIAGWAGVGLFLVQAFVAIAHLEVVNYIEHYGLTRRKLDNGRYEPVRPHHSWNANHKVSNWMLINLQRHSDHHYKPARRFPLLQSYDPDTAPQLPFGYPLMMILALVPPAWRRVMRPRLAEWRARHYPDIAHWSDMPEARPV
ncbi:MAG: alkane 1-monooxygenase [Pseudomonadota bacterium]